MAKNNVADLLSVGSLFTTQAERDEAQRETVRDIPLEEISDFPNHPFKVRMDESMMEMVDSVKQYGVLVPALVRPKPDGGYEMIAGHRRRMASELAEKPTLSCIVRDMTDDEATIVMVDSNLQREQILPSEKAFAYKLKLDAMKRQGQRSDLTCATPLHKFSGKKSRDVLAEQTGESHEQIRKYVRLTHLIPTIWIWWITPSSKKRRCCKLPSVLRWSCPTSPKKNSRLWWKSWKARIAHPPMRRRSKCDSFLRRADWTPMCCCPSCRRKSLTRWSNSKCPRSVFQNSSRRGRPRRKWRIPS